MNLSALSSGWGSRTLPVCPLFGLLNGFDLPLLSRYSEVSIMATTQAMTGQGVMESLSTAAKRVSQRGEGLIGLRDSEQIPLTTEGGIDALLEREVLPYAADVWYRPEKVKIGYEISFTRYFYQPQPLRTLEEIREDILALERETEGLLGEIL